MAKRKTVEDAYNNAERAAGGGKNRWQRFKENALVQGVSSGVTRFARFGKNKMSHVGQDIVAGYHAFKANRKDRHAVDDWGNNLDYLAGRGVTFTMQADGSFRAEGTTDAGRALLKRIEDAFGGRASDGRKDVPVPDAPPVPDDKQVSGKQDDRQVPDAGNKGGVPDTAQADASDPGNASPQDTKDAGAGAKDDPAAPAAGTDADQKKPNYDINAILDSLKDNSVSSTKLDVMLYAIVQTTQEYLSAPDNERDQRRGKMFEALAAVGNAGKQVVDRGKSVDDDLGSSLPDGAQAQPDVQKSI